MTVPTNSSDGEAMRFALVWRERTRADVPTLGTQTPRRFLDYELPGQSFYEAFGGDFISPFGWLPSEAEEEYAKRLLRELPPQLDGRVEVLVCPECADADCGAVTVRVERMDRHIIWRNPAFSSPNWDTAGWEHETANFDGWPELRFHVSEYWAAITSRPRAENP